MYTIVCENNLNYLNKLTWGLILKFAIWNEKILKVRKICIQYSILTRINDDWLFSLLCICFVIVPVTFVTSCMLPFTEKLEPNNKMIK